MCFYIYIASLNTAILLADVLTASDMRMLEKLRHKGNLKNFLHIGLIHSFQCKLYIYSGLVWIPALKEGESVQIWQQNEQAGTSYLHIQSYMAQNLHHFQCTLSNLPD